MSQHRPALLYSKMEIQIWHFFFAFLRFILLQAPFLLITYIPRGKDTKSLLLAYNLLTTELQKVLYLPLLYCKDWSQLHYLSDMNLFNREGKTRGQNRKYFTILYKWKLTAMHQSPQKLKNNKPSYCAITKKCMYVCTLGCPRMFKLVN